MSEKLSVESITTNMSLHIDNLVINLIQMEDSKSVVDYVNENRSFLQPWEPTRKENYYTEAGWLQRIQQISQLQHHGMYYQFLIREFGESEILGTIIYQNFVHFPSHSAVVGYALSEHAQGRGIMTRCLGVTNQWVMEKHNLHRIQAAYMERNHRSAAVLETLGFKHEGIAEGFLLINGQWEDHLMTALVNQDWKPRKEHELELMDKKHEFSCFFICYCLIKQQ